MYYIRPVSMSATSKLISFFSIPFDSFNYFAHMLIEISKIVHVAKQLALGKEDIQFALTISTDIARGIDTPFNINLLNLYKN
jgi:hypothetical protein